MKEIGENFLKPTSEQELLEAIKKMKSRSSPAPGLPLDGLPTEFYRTYRPILGSIIVELVVERSVTSSVQKEMGMARPDLPSADKFGAGTQHLYSH